MGSPSDLCPELFLSSSAYTTGWERSKERMEEYGFCLMALSKTHGRSPAQALPRYGIHTVSNQIVIAKREMVVAEKATIGREGGRMG